MPIYCDICEEVIDRDEELTRIDGTDYCLNCAESEMEKPNDNRTSGQGVPCDRSPQG